MSKDVLEFDMLQTNIDNKLLQISLQIPKSLFKNFKLEYLSNS